MKIRNIIILGLATLSLTGCKSLYGTYKRPEVKTDGLVRDPINDQTTLEGANDFGQLPWRDVFTDPNLQAIIEKTLTNNPDLLNAALNIDIAEQQLGAAKLAFLPSLAFAPQGTITHFGSHVEVTKSYTLPIASSWEIDLFGNLRNAKKAAQMAALTKNTWDIMQLQMDYGRARATSVQSAQSAYYGVQARATDIKKQTREVENSLSLLMGEPVHSIVRGTLDNQKLPLNFSGGIGVEILSNRADVHANEMALAKCFYNVNQARARFYPSLSITASGGWSNGNGMVNPAKLLFNAIGKLTQPIFMQGKLRAGLRVAEDQYKIAYNKWQNSVLTAGSEVSNALVAYNAAEEKDVLYTKQIEILKKNVEQTQMLYNQSSSSYLEVITAQQNLLNAEISQVQDQFSKLQAIVNLYYALGGGSK